MPQQKWFILIFLAGFTSACGTVSRHQESDATSASVVVNSVGKRAEVIKIELQLPKWLVDTPKDYVTACAKIKNSNIVQAKKVALIKAKSEYLATKQVKLKSESVINRHVTDKNGVVDSEIRIDEEIKQNTAGEVDHVQYVRESDQVTIDGIVNYCVLFG